MSTAVLDRLQLQDTISSDMVLLEDFLKAYPQYIIAHNRAAQTVEVYHLRATEDLTHGMIEQVRLHLNCSTACCSILQSVQKKSSLLQLLAASHAQKTYAYAFAASFTLLVLPFVTGLQALLIMKLISNGFDPFLAPVSV